MTESSRKDLADLVRTRRAQLGLTLRELASRCVDPQDPDAGAMWTHATIGNLESKTIKAPDLPKLRALAKGLDLPLRLVQEAAGVQYMGIETTWSDDGETRTLVHHYWELSPEDRAKVQAMLEAWGSLGRRDAP
ncbi:helix-turn-helix domain-containing protein [Streptomyces sp. NRRL S-1813]|uniref:helix-turn-helix domain-containing protein n=1 Tax=Streptomyces sp. NRRL S-1813 TaxID=1463888 RepID=UPI0004CC11AC|nr:helix-turn-helix transcriptional regulator [Streptomyces sp. NRRL S-1813]